MAKKRKIRCDCGTYFEERKHVFEGIDGKAMVCPKCGFHTFTREHAEEFVKALKMKEITKKNRKIIKIGNSKGITIPKSFNIKIGQKAKIEILTSNSFKVVFKKSFV